ncbi:MAG: glycerol-3-phosphate acyltransferase [Desulfobacteraceae bacterium]|nr:MAG: glycerol-3-phosphate acyltransferase [Desulfobacteraceae bacterium]
MGGQITISLWVFLFIAALALLGLLDRILIPSTRWFLRRRINRVLDEIGTRLDIEIRPFQLTKRQVLIDRLVFDPQVMKVIQEYAHTHDMPQEVVQNRVMLYAKEIVPSFNAYLYFRIGYWIAKKAARMLYRVRVGLLREDRYAEVDTDSTIVFVMNHRSNMDYVLVAFLAAERTTLSYAVGEWAKVWPLHMLIRAMGAFFVRRNSGDPLYRKVLERYIHMASREGVCQAVFLEGGLSRDGRMRAPKLGLLDYMLRGFDPDADRDIVFIPVGINYDRTLEDRSLLRTLTPEAEKRSRWFSVRTTCSFIARNLAQMALQRWHRFGYACVNFGAPLSARAYCREHRVRFDRLPRPERFQHVQALSKTLMRAVAEVVPILPLSLVATVFLNTREARLDIQAIDQRCRQVLFDMRQRGAPVLEIPHSTLTRMIAEAVSHLQLRHMLTAEDGRYTANDKEIPLLRYYANSIAHFWADEQEPYPTEQTGIPDRRSRLQ